MEPEKINVTKSEEFSTLRQTITPTSRETVIDELDCILGQWREKKCTGVIAIMVNQGGVRRFVAEEHNSA